MYVLPHQGAKNLINHNFPSLVRSAKSLSVRLTTFSEPNCVEAKVTQDALIAKPNATTNAKRDILLES